jgi:hypothetical protein
MGAGGGAGGRTLGGSGSGREKAAAVRDRWGQKVDAEVLAVLGTMHEILLFTWAAALVSCVPARAIFCVC